jgi:hypothetical protein
MHRISIKAFSHQLTATPALRAGACVSIPGCGGQEASELDPSGFCGQKTAWFKYREVILTLRVAVITLRVAVIPAQAGMTNKNVKVT